MISQIRGKLIEKNPTLILVEAADIGYEIHIPFSTFEALEEIGDQVVLRTHLYVREDQLTLYGFLTSEERELFRQLLMVSGIGPKLALGILSGSKIHDFYRHIAQGDETALTKIRGLGKKTAQRLIIDLKDKARDKIDLADWTIQTMTNLSLPHNIVEEAVLAMQALGYSRPEAERVLSMAVRKLGTECQIEDLLREALKS